MSTQTASQSTQDRNVFQASSGANQNQQANYQRAEGVFTQKLHWDGNVDVFYDVNGGPVAVSPETHLTILAGSPFVGNTTFNIADPINTHVMREKVVVLITSPGAQTVAITATTPRGWSSTDFPSQYSAVILKWLPAENNTAAQGWYIETRDRDVPGIVVG